MTPQEIGTLPDWITADDVEIWTTAKILVSHAGWDNDYVSRFNMSTDADSMAKANEGMASIDAQHLVRSAVVMRKWIYAIAPRGSPVVLRVERFDQLCSLLSACRDCRLVNKQRQPWIVRYFASVGKLMGFHLTHGCEKIIETLLRNQGKIDGFRSGRMSGG